MASECLGPLLSYQGTKQYVMESFKELCFPNELISLMESYVQYHQHLSVRVSDLVPPSFVVRSKKDDVFSNLERANMPTTRNPAKIRKWRNVLCTKNVQSNLLWRFFDGHWRINDLLFGELPLCVSVQLRDL
jgi:hypothetical protein